MKYALKAGGMIHFMLWQVGEITCNLLHDLFIVKVQINLNDHSGCNMILFGYKT